MVRTVIPLIVLAMALLLWPGCHAQPSIRTAATGLQLEPLEMRVDVILGQQVVIPVEFSGARIPDEIPLRLDDRRTIPARVFWIGVEDDASSATSWLSPPGRWSASPASSAQEPAARDRRDGWWALLLDLPHDAINQAVSFGGTRIPLNWYLHPGEGDVAEPRPPHTRWSTSGQLLGLARPEMLSPVRRWRYRLLVDGLSIESPSPEVVAFDEPVLEAIARQYELRWTVALGMLELTDPALAKRLKRRLTLVVMFPDGTGAPMWPIDEDALAFLLSDLLNTSIGPEERSARAAAWLDGQPSAAAWIVDDSGVVDASSGEILSTSALANLLDRSMVASAVVIGGSRSPDLREMPELSVRMLTPAAPATDRSRAVSPRQIQFNIGRWSAVRSVVTDAVPVAPPGLRMEPMTGDWTLAGLLTGAPVPSMRIGSGSSTSALLHYRALEHAHYAAGETPPGAWMLHLECKGEPGAADEVVVWLGPHGATRGILRVSSNGSAEFLTAGGNRQGLLTGVTVVQLADRWITKVPLPAGMIESTGELRLAIVRTDSRGVRSAWPRPMLPWQREPGRLAIDTTAWGAVIQPGATAR
jgi:hypothetical protein